MSDAKTIVEVIWLLPSRAAKEFRRDSAKTIVRVLGGDVSMCQKIETRYAQLQMTKEGRAYQSFMAGESPRKKARIGPAIMEYARKTKHSQWS